MEMPTLRQLEYAIAVADEGHFGRAAARVAVSQPGLSAQIRTLEARLGVELFERTTRGATTTSAGTAVIDRARRLLRDVADLQRMAAASHGVVSGPVGLGAIPTVGPYVLPTTVRVVRRLWPESVLTLREPRTDQLVEAIGVGQLDLGLLAIPYDTGSLVVEPLIEDPFLLAMPAGHPLTDDEAPLPVADLADLSMLLLEEGHCLRDHALNVCRTAGAADQHQIAQAGLATLTQMVAGGAGVTLLPTSALAVEARPGSGITTRRFADPAPSRTLALAWRRSDPRGSLFDALAKQLRQALVAERQPSAT